MTGPSSPARNSRPIGSNVPRNCRANDALITATRGELFTSCASMSRPLSRLNPNVENQPGDTQFTHGALSLLLCSGAPGIDSMFVFHRMLPTGTSTDVDACVTP